MRAVLQSVRPLPGWIPDRRTQNENAAFRGGHPACIPDDSGVNQLRDPAIFEESGRIYLLYAVAGENGIAIAEVHLD